MKKNAAASAAQAAGTALLLLIQYKYLFGALGADALGLWSLIIATVSLSRIGEIGLSGSTTRYVAVYFANSEYAAIAEVVETIILSVVVVLIFIIVCTMPIMMFSIERMVPIEKHVIAWQIAPWVAVSLVFGVTATITQSALDGIGKIPTRNFVLFASNLYYVGMTFLLVPKFGIQGVAIAQASQLAMTLVVLWVILKFNVPQFGWVPRVWRFSRLKEIANYSAALQVSGVIALSIEPLTKMIVSYFGGLSAVAYYELGNQVLSRTRGVLTSAQQAVLPEFSSTGRTDTQKLKAIFKRSYRLVLLIGLPYIMIVYAMIPIASLLVLGELVDQFLTISRLMFAGWVIGALGIPCYFLCLGIGDSAIVMKAQLMNLLLTAAMSTSLGYLWGVNGVVVGGLFALILSQAPLSVHAMNILAQSAKPLIRKKETRGTVAALAMYGSIVTIHAFRETESRETNVIFESFCVVLAVLCVGVLIRLYVRQRHDPR